LIKFLSVGCSIGTQTIFEREQCLNKVGALQDEWIIERRIQLLIDEDKIQQAKDLLLSTPWQKGHQTYTYRIVGADM